MKASSTEAPKNLSPARAALDAKKAMSVGPAAATPKTASTKKPLFSIGGETKFPFKELIKFCRGMASMLKAKINTSDAIGYYAEGHPNASVRSILLSIKKELDIGVPVYSAFKKTGKFDDKFISLIRAGSDTGHLNNAFESIGKRLKKEKEFKAKMRKATLLPVIIIFTLVLMF